MTELELRKKRMLEVFMSPQYKPLKIKELAILLDIPKEDRPKLLEVLDALLAEGKIGITGHGKYFYTKGTNKPKEDEILVEGTFLAKQKGIGFVKIDDTEDIYIAKDDTLGALNNDKVQVSLLHNGKKEYGKSKEGRVVKILEHANSMVVGLFVKTKHFAFVLPDDQKLTKDIFIDEKNFHGAVDGHKVVVKILNYGDRGKNPEGEVVEILGHKNDPGVDILSIIKAYGIPTDYPQDVMKQLEDIPEAVSEEEKLGRKDCRNELTVTIDGDDAKDLDDAISLSVTPEGDYMLGVHIADVSHYVKEGSPIDVEARKRGTSVYLLDRVIPMLPHKLSNGICSLNEGVDRLALSCIMRIDANGNVIDSEITKTVIRVDRRMSYSVVKNLLSPDCDEKHVDEYKPLIPLFELMAKLSGILRTKRYERGAIDFDFPEAKIILDDRGKPKEIVPYERNVATKLIEDFMLIANETIAENYFWQHIPFLYRNHEAPEEEKMRQLSLFLGGFGHSLHVNNQGLHPKKLQSVLKELENTDEYTIVSRVMLRSMKQARYASENLGHFGLAAKYYTHFTSPIRRYPDLQIHRIISETFTEKGVCEEHYNKILPDVALFSSKFERRAEEAERDVIKRKKAQYMVKHIGEEYEGIISGVTNFGIFVELPNTIEGLVRLQELGDDYYVFDEAHYRVVGDMMHRVFSLGQHVKVMVSEVDTDLSTVSFRMLSKGEKQGGQFTGTSKKKITKKKNKR